MEYHTPVLRDEIIRLLDIKPSQIFIDATLGHGGHTIEVLKKGGVVYGLDMDQNNLETATSRIKSLDLAKHFYPIKDNFCNLPKIIDQLAIQNVSGIIMDLGLSQNQQKSTGRGFSFNDNTSLDMRLDPDSQQLTAEEIINTYSYQELFDIFSKLSQEKLTKPLVYRIISARQKKPFKNGFDLAQLIRDFYLQKGIKSKIDPSTKIFLALRIVVNQEIQNLKNVLKDTLTLSQLQQAIICIISFNSGEDRIVKQFIRQNHPGLLTNLTPKAIVPDYSEVKSNPLSRSAVLRSYKIN